MTSNVGVPVELRTTLEELVNNMVQHLAVAMVKAWERSQQIAGESWVAQLRFSGLCGHGPMGIPLDFDGEITNGSLIFRNFHIEHREPKHMANVDPNSMRKNMFHRPSGFFHLLPTVVRVFHTMRVPISPLETSNHLDDSLGSSCRSEPKVYLKNPLVYHTPPHV